MDRLIDLHNGIFDQVAKLDGLIPLLARLVFAGTLLGYFWASGMTKLGDGFFGFLALSTGAYAQIFPRQMEAVLYDTSQLGVFHWAVVTAGTWAEFILPLLIVLGLLTRLASLGMIGFVIVQSLTDLYGHGGIQHPETLGAWFDKVPDSAILDQRAFWVLVLAILVIKGAGALSLDRILGRQVLGQTAPV
ncbi:DoxX family membrane protein [Aestuariicoccus sp. MJ-SS9]|uniref:DoxX family membrane protein n=1 Tax=Aestuariicoccus sp. MJ-SS9 TaxID=3079855 RepID=UPI002906B271|nr:DoxX family membrane protein [Aestuariicoccus sp. MJ-SS9]MDU8910286.1 DoxX family membrane protein [Aestuariicoccus sp. MJ-SS9]